MQIRLASFAFALSCFPIACFAQASSICTSDLMVATPVRPALLSPVAIELSPGTTQLGGGSGVLSQAFDEALSVDNVLLRIRQDGCRAMASVKPVGSVVDPNDPATYKPKTEFDNTPWRFNMTQNGKRMTADEFDAWMKTRGVRVAKGTVPTEVPSSASAVPSTPAPNPSSN